MEGVREFRRDVREVADQVDRGLGELEQTAREAEARATSFWDRVTNPFSFDGQGRNWVVLTRELESMNKRIQIFNLKTLVGVGLFILGCAVQSWILGFIAGWIIADNLWNEEKLKADVQSIKTHPAYNPEIQGGTLHFFSLIISQFNIRDETGRRVAI